MRKRIAKLMSIIDHYTIESNQDKNISFASEDVYFADQMVGNDSDTLDTNNTVYMYKHGDISGMKVSPVQQDGMNY